MKRYCLFILENGHYIFVGDRKGYATFDEAVAAAKRHVDDALPRNTVRVMCEVGYAFLASDGSEDFREWKEGEK